MKHFGFGVGVLWNHCVTIWLGAVRFLLHSDCMLAANVRVLGWAAVVYCGDYISGVWLVSRGRPPDRWHPFFFSRRKSFGSGHEKSSDFSAIDSLSTVLCLDISDESYILSPIPMHWQYCGNKICVVLRVGFRFSYITPIKFSKLFYCTCAVL